MRTFVLRARAAPTDSQKLLASIGKEAHAEILAHTLMNAIFVAQSHRADVRVYLVLESTQDFSRTICFDVNAMHEIGGFDERALLGKVAKALDVSRGMGKEETRTVESGVTVRTLSFERLVQELAVDHQLFVMDRKGTSIREQTFEAQSLLPADRPYSDAEKHLPYPRATGHKEALAGFENAVCIAMRRVAPPRAGPALITASRALPGHRIAVFLFSSASIRCSGQMAATGYSCALPAIRVR